jgi:hypothetical protein
MLNARNGALRTIPANLSHSRKEEDDDDDNFQELFPSFYLSANSYAKQALRCS